MSTAPRPLVVLTGAIHPDAHAELEREARVAVAPDLSEAGLQKAAAEASGILFRGGGHCTEGLMAACGHLRVVGRHGVGLDNVDIPAATRLGIELAGKTLGIVGVGNIGRRVAAFTGAIGMRVLGYDKYVPDDEVRRRGAEPVASLVGAGLDVFEEEPSSVDNPIFGLPSVVCSTHVAGVTKETSRQSSLQVTREILRVLRGERPHVLANPEVWPRPAQRP